MKASMMLVLATVLGCQEAPAGDGTKGGGTEDSATPLACGVGALEGIAVGLCAPDFNLPDSTGVMTSLSSFRGRVALVDISALW
jgi:cytochrome oxidase Cu insertion factor (SCO1/SenC/PrrC family)